MIQPGLRRPKAVRVSVTRPRRSGAATDACLPRFELVWRTDQRPLLARLERQTVRIIAGPSGAKESLGRAYGVRRFFRDLARQRARLVERVVAEARRQAQSHRLRA